MPGIHGADKFAEALRQFEQAGMTNPENNVLYSGAQQQAQQQSGVNNPFSFAGQFVNYLKDKAMDYYHSEPEVKRDLQGNVISDTGVNENLIELMRNRPDLLRK